MNDMLKMLFPKPIHYSFLDGSILCNQTGNSFFITHDINNITCKKCLLKLEKLIHGGL